MCHEAIELPFLLLYLYVFFFFSSGLSRFPLFTLHVRLYLFNWQLRAHQKDFEQ